MEQSINLELFLSQELKMKCQSLLSFMLFFVMIMVLILRILLALSFLCITGSTTRFHYKKRKTSRFPSIFSISILYLITSVFVLDCVKISHLLNIKRSTVQTLNSYDGMLYNQTRQLNNNCTYCK